MGNHDLVSDSFLALTGVDLVLLSSSLLAFAFTQGERVAAFRALVIHASV